MAILGLSQVQRTDPKLLNKLQSLEKSFQKEAKTLKMNGKDVEFVIYKNSCQGSNEGYWAKVKDSTDLYYVKYGGEAQLRSEKLASELYKLAGTESAEIQIIEEALKPKYAWNPDKRIGLASKFKPFEKNVDIFERKAYVDGFGADCWLANWDAAKQGNAVMSNGKAVRLDVGGSLNYRARGGRKGAVFGEDVKELTSFLGNNSHSRAYLNDMSREELINSLMKVGKVSDEEIASVINGAVDEKISFIGSQKIVSKKGIKNPEFLKEMLSARRDYIKKFAMKCVLNEQKPNESMPDYIRRIDALMPKTQYKLPFDKIGMSCEVKEIKDTTLAEHLTIKQKKLYDSSYDAYLASGTQKIRHNANDILTTDNLLHATNYGPKTFKTILEEGITTGDLRSLAQSGTGAPTQTPLCADFWDIKNQKTIKEYFSKPLGEFAQGELNFLPAKNYSGGTNMVVVLNKKAANKTLVENSFLVNGGETILRTDGNIGGHPYPTHRAVPLGLPSNCIDRVIIRKEKFTPERILEMKDAIKAKGLDIKIYDLDRNLI